MFTFNLEVVNALTRKESARSLVLIKLFVIYFTSAVLFDSS